MALSFTQKQRVEEIVLTTAIAIYVIALTAYAIGKHNSFTTYAWDLGIFDQAFWTTVNQDRWFEYTCERHLTESSSFFGVHFSPLLFTLIPAYYMLQRAETLLLLQSILLGLSAIPIYRIGRIYLEKKQACLFALLYLLNPALHGVNSYDFHVQAFLPLTLGYLTYYELTGRTPEMLLAAFLSLAVQEQVVYILAAFALWKALRVLWSRDFEARRRGVASLGMLVALVFMWWVFAGRVIHHFNPQIPEHLKAGQHYAVLGVDDPLEIPVYVLTHPYAVLRALNYDWYNKVWYLLALFSPYLLFSFRKPQALIPTVPWFAISLLSNYPPYYRLGFQYPAYVIPFIASSAIQGAGDITASQGEVKTGALFKVLTALAIGLSLAVSPLSPLTRGLHLSPAYEKPHFDARTDKIHQIMGMVPSNASILTQDNFFPHFSNRGNAYVMVPSTYRDVQTWKKAINWVMGLEAEYILIDLETDPHNTIRYAFTIAKKKGYGLQAYFDNVYLYSLGYAGQPQKYEGVNIVYSVYDLVPQNMVYVEDAGSTMGTILVFENTSIASKTLWYGPYDILPRGNYTAYFTLKALRPNPNTTITLDAYCNGTRLNHTSIKEADLGNDSWAVVPLGFRLEGMAYDLELRGFLEGNETSIALDTIRLEESPESKRLKALRGG